MSERSRGGSSSSTRSRRSPAYLRVKIGPPPAGPGGGRGQELRLRPAARRAGARGLPVGAPGDRRRAAATRRCARRASWRGSPTRPSRRSSTTARDADYARAGAGGARARAGGPARRGRRRPGPRARPTAPGAPAQAARRGGRAIDFFGAPGRRHGRGAAGRDRGAASGLRERPAPRRAAAVTGRRPRAGRGSRGRAIHVDRMASAWLIRRFIDPEARFKFVRGPRAPRAAPGSCASTCSRRSSPTRATSARSRCCSGASGSTDPALRRIGEIVHDIDLKDGKFGRPEAPGLDRLHRRHRPAPPRGRGPARARGPRSSSRSTSPSRGSGDGPDPRPHPRATSRRCSAATSASPRSRRPSGSTPRAAAWRRASSGARPRGGGFHIKAAGLELGRLYFAAKTNANFPDNPRRHGLPAIQGVDRPLRRRRRPAAGGHGLDRGHDPPHGRGHRGGRAAGWPGPTRTTRDHLRLRRARGARSSAPWRACCRCGAPTPSTRDAGRRPPVRRELSAELGIEVTAGDRSRGGGRARSDVCVTCTPSREPLPPPRARPAGDLRGRGGRRQPGQAGARSRAHGGAAVVVADVLEQCASIGDLHHALEAGALTRDDVHAELAEVVTGRKPGRRSAGGDHDLRLHGHGAPGRRGGGGRLREGGGGGGGPAPERWRSAPWEVGAPAPRAAPASTSCGWARPASAVRSRSSATCSATSWRSGAGSRRRSTARGWPWPSSRPGPWRRSSPCTSAGCAAERAGRGARRPRLRAAVLRDGPRARRSATSASAAWPGCRAPSTASAPPSSRSSRAAPSS